MRVLTRFHLHLHRRHRNRGCRRGHQPDFAEPKSESGTGSESYTATDTGLKGETVYYSLFPYAGNPPNYDIDRHNRGGDGDVAYNIAGQMADLLPTLYHRYDTVVTNAAP